jgi:hypothetical protein
MAIYLPQTLVQLVERGANVHIEDGGYLPQTLIQLASIAARTGAHITISGNYLPSTLEQLAAIAGRNLTVIVRRNKS